MNRIVHFILAALTLWSVSVSSGAEPLDPATLAKAGADTARKLNSAFAAWEVSNVLANGQIVHVSTVRAGDKERIILSLVSGRQKVELERIIVRDGLWYVADKNGFFRYRPYEAPTDSTAIYIAMDRSEPRFILSPAHLANSRLEAVVDDVATFRGNLDPTLAQQLKAKHTCRAPRFRSCPHISPKR